MHPFHECPLRSSSLLIINKEKHIVTATDELFDILGYADSSQLLGKSIDLLCPMKNESLYLLKHASAGYISFEICIHHDPLASTGDLDYWLLQPINTKPQKNSVLGPTTLLRLSPFGTIESAYPSIDFPQIHSQLRHLPIMSFIHESDVRTLCYRLSQTRYTAHYTLRIRWLDQRQKPTDESNFQWVLMTVMNAPRRLPCSSLNDLQSQPICVIRKVYETQEEMSDLQMSAITSWQVLCIDAAYKVFDQAKRGGIGLYQIVESIHLALDQGKSYLVEFFAHVLHYLLEFLGEIEYFSQADNINDTNESDRKNVKKAKRCYKRSNMPSVKVYDDTHTWTVPLFRKKF